MSKIDLSKLITADDKLKTAKSAKVAALSAACESAILAGFTCDALGEPHYYPTNFKDQQNLLSSIADSMLAANEPDWTTPFWCTPVGMDDWAMRPHTHDQIQLVGREAKAVVLSLMAKNLSLAKDAQEAMTPEDLDKIQWDEPPVA
ncbi:hypothetical protein L1889_18415 [Paenalcaligenes niemegkensis]|uniref:DUF4376 domain-containing protein n=1 Tax=Paenalcaligenes niemegkensis TaxID=2895469 RepID=UPI001EE953AD|nr:hypothetical protein [Paenalcaligenes niemegkensis]MCQ9618415.1 hypothetical protein [Paenalcaligenes niemegkensis]